MKLRKIVDVAVLIGIGVCIGGMASDVSSADHYLSEWQTLVAGVLAVIAAAWTVDEMRRSDERQQVRHDQLVTMQLRGQRLIAERVAYVQGHFKKALEMIDSLPKGNYQEDGARSLTKSELTQLTFIFTGVKSALQLQALKDAIPLMDVRMTAIFEYLQSARNALQSAYDDAIGMLVTEKPDAAKSSAIANEMTARFLEMRDLMQEFVECLGSLKEAYQ